MWLDRFQGQPSPSGTPSPQGRPYSPAPQRYPSAGQFVSRSTLTPPRSSSLPRQSISNTNLSSTARVQSGSGLKSQASNAPPPDVPDPLKVLEQIVGISPQSQAATVSDGDTGTAEKPALVDDMDFGGLSLQAFAEREEPPARRTSHVHNQNSRSIEEFNREKDKFVDLHESIAACDNVLKNVETYLTAFRADLVTVSAEIETLQSRSISLTTKLENRKVVEKLLGPAVEDMSISPAVVRKIAEGPMDEGWIAALAELEKRSRAIHAKAKQQGKIRAVSDLQPLLDDLTTKAIERIRDFLVLQIKAIRSPSMNAQILQQQTFLKFKDLYAFLTRHHRQLADEICQAYVNTMRWYYLNNFTRYHRALERMRIHVVDKTETLAQDDPVRRGQILSNASMKAPGAPYDAFSLGRRLDILKSHSPSAISSYLAEEDKSTHYIETPFHSFNLALIDNASFEYTFLSTFFSPAQSYQAIARTFSTIFEPTFQLGQSLTKTLLESSADALGMLLAVRINQHFAFALQRRRVPAVEGYVNGTNMLLWPRLQLALDAHCESVRRAAAALSGRPQASSTLLASASASSAASAAQSTAPHPLTQRFANFMHGLLALSSEAGDDEPVANSLVRLRNEFETYLAKMSRGIADQRKRERFLYNNYSLVATILEGTEGRLADDMTAHFAAERDARAEAG